MKKIVFLFLIFSILLVMPGCRDEERSQQTSIDISELETQSTQQKVETGKITWEISNVEDLGVQLTTESGYDFQAERGKFINVTFDIWNNSNESRTIYDLRVIDGQGRSYNICVEAYAYLAPSPEGACTLVELLPNDRRSFNATFDVETDVEELVLEVTDLKLPPESVKYVDLGI